MVSEMMLEDAEDLAKRGIALTPREIVRLNALGIKAERSPSQTNIFTLPRCCIIGDIVFREPTIGHEIWLDEMSALYDVEDGLTSFAVTALCYSTEDADDLPRPADGPALSAAVRAFIKDRLARYTIRQIAAAVRYVRDGIEQTDGELGPDSKAEDPGETDQDCAFSSALGVVHEGQSLGLGITLADARRMTRPALRSVIARAYLVKGVDVTKGDRETAMGDYNVVLDEIIKKHEESANG